MYEFRIRCELEEAEGVLDALASMPEVAEVVEVEGAILPDDQIEEE